MSDQLRADYEKIIARGNDDPAQVSHPLPSSPLQVPACLQELRKMVLLRGLPPESPAEESHDGPPCGLRGRVWKILLRVERVDAEEYLGYVAKGKSSRYDSIRNDTFRTFPQDEDFKSRVSEESLIRLLNAFVHDTEAHPDPSGLTLGPYVQGMNVLSAPLLFVMPEPDAFACFRRLIRHHCPLYVQPTLEGVHFGLKLLDEVLKTVDPELYRFLLSKQLTAEVYAFPSVLTLCGNTPPLTEVLRVWDVLLSFGVHLNVVIAVARYVLMRDKLMASDSPQMLLNKKLPPLEADKVLPLAISLVRQLPEQLYNLLVRHPFDTEVLKDFI